MSTKRKEIKDTSFLTDKSDAEKKSAPDSLKKCMPEFFEVTEKRLFSSQLSQMHLYNNERNVISSSDSLITALQDRLEVKGFKMAQAILDLSIEKRGVKLRDDDKTPRILHDVEQAIWTIDALESGYEVEEPELLVALVLSHDLGEEYGVTPAKMLKYLEENGIKNDKKVITFLKSYDAISKYFGDDEHAAYKNKEYKGKNIDGHYKDEEDYQNGVRENPHASVAKMFDRAHNLMTLIGVRDKDVIHKEIAKTMHYYEDKHIEEMCDSFPSHRDIYEMLEETLEAQLKILRYFTLDVADTLPSNRELLGLMPTLGFYGLPAGLHPLIATAERVRNSPSPQPDEKLGNEL